MVHNRLPFFEVLSFQADFPISDFLFDVSEPTTLGGVETKVVIKPKNNSFFGNRVVQYRRFDLSEIPRISVKRHGAKTFSDIVRNLQLYPMFKYRVFDRRFPDQVAIRYLHLQPSDVQDALLPSIVVSGQHYELNASALSDCFIGALKISLM